MMSTSHRPTYAKWKPPSPGIMLILMVQSLMSLKNGKLGVVSYTKFLLLKIKERKVIQ